MQSAIGRSQTYSAGDKPEGISKVSSIDETHKWLKTSAFVRAFSVPFAVFVLNSVA
jgi:hypothetical protein